MVWSNPYPYIVLYSPPTIRLMDYTKALHHQCPLFKLRCGGSSSGSTSGRTTDREVPSLIPAGCWPFYFSFFRSLTQWCFLHQIPHVGATLLLFNYPGKNGGLAVLLDPMQALYALKEQKKLSCDSFNIKTVTCTLLTNQARKAESSLSIFHSQCNNNANEQVSGK